MLFFSPFAQGTDSNYSLEFKNRGRALQIFFYSLHPEIDHPSGLP
jgi:hypothetical protein